MVQSFYLVKFHDFKDPELESKIQQGCKAIQRIYDTQAPIIEELKQAKMIQDEFRLALSRRCWYYRGDWVWGPDSGEGHLAYLQLCLQKLSSLDEVVCIKLTSFALSFFHKAKREILGALFIPLFHLKLIEVFFSYSFKNLDRKVQCISRRLIHTGRGTAPSRRREREIYREIDKLKHPREEVVLAKEKQIADVQKEWRTSSPENCKWHIEYQIKLYMDHRRYEAGKTRIEEAMSILKGKLEDMNRSRAREHQRILGAKKLLDAANADYNQYEVTIARAKELGQRNCFDTLSELSNREIERFMSRWNSDATFRTKYERSVQPSLHKRGLNLDGRVRNPDEEEALVEEQKRRVLPPPTTKRRFKWNDREPT